MGIDFGVVLAYALGVILLFFIGRIFLMPIKLILKLVYNALIGGIALLLINFIGAYFNFHIAFNIINAILVGVLGVPGVALVIVLKYLF